MNHKSLRTVSLLGVKNMETHLETICSNQNLKRIYINFDPDDITESVRKSTKVTVTEK